MKQIDLTREEWKHTRTIFDFFKKDTDCLDEKGRLLVKPKYVVAIDDDMISAYNAAVIMKKSLLEFGYYPVLLCCGGKSLYSKYLNCTSGQIISDAQKLKQISVQLYNPPHIEVLDKGTNTGEILKEISDFAKNDIGPIIFCPTQRRSKRLERAIAFLSASDPVFAKTNTFWYVPEENLEDMLAYYNGRIIAGGIPLLSEAAVLFYRLGTARYVGKYMACYDGDIPKFVIKAGIALKDDYPLRITRSWTSAPWQACKQHFGFINNEEMIKAELQEKIEYWKFHL